MHHKPAVASILILLLTSLAARLPSDSPPLAPYPGTGMFLFLSDLHFDPYADPAIMKQLGAQPKAPCLAPASTAYSPYGRDTNVPLLKSALENVAATALANHFHYDYVVVTGDFLAHNFDTRYRQCVGAGDAAYQKFAADTVRFVGGQISQALPGVPVFATLGNNDTDRGDYEKPSAFFLARVGQDWSRAWGNVPALERDRALASFGREGNYAVRDPATPNHEFIIVNSNLWVARNTQACTESDPDPGGEFEWLGEELSRLKASGSAATLVMHVLPGIDAMRSSLGATQAFWTEACTQRFITTLSAYRGVARQIYAGHIHRDDFRVLTDSEDKPLLPIHIVPAISPVYLNNPAAEVGWYDKQTGELRDYAALSLDLDSPRAGWRTEYVFSRAYGRPRPDLAALAGLGRELRDGSPTSGVGEKFAAYYGAGVAFLISPDNWRVYTCAQTEFSASRFAECEQAGARPHP